MFKHMRIFAVGLLAAMIFAGCGESSKSSSKSSEKSSNSSSANKKKSKKKSKKLDPKKLLAEGKKAMEEDEKRGIVFNDTKYGIVLKKFPKNSNIKNYKIPYGVTIIDSAFSGCTNLTSVTIPSSVKYIGSDAFKGCTNLTNIKLPDSIEGMHYSAFDNIKAVIASPNNPNFYFDNRGVLFNKKTKSLLAAPRNLTGSYVIPNSVTKIGLMAFSGCTKLTSVTIPSSVTYIGEVAFWGCKNLSSITIPDSVTEIGDGAFNACTNLTSITIPNSVTEIGDYAFVDCVNLTSITIPDSVTVIGFDAFWGCKKLTSVTLPDTIESMPDSVFDNIKEVIAAQKNPNFYFDNRGVLFNKKTKSLLCAPSNLTGNYVIPNSVTKIGEYAFWFCTNLSSVTIPDSVTKIGYSAFSHCTKLTSITLPARFKGQEKSLGIPKNCKVTYR